MKPAPFDYHAPVGMDECLALLAEFGEDAALIAGGQSLLPLMRFRLAQPEHLISIRNIDGPLASIQRSNGSLFIGARVTYSAVQRSVEAASACPGLGKAIALIATPAVRTCGTICGNLVNADPASELPAVALVMNARFHLRSAMGERVVPAAEFFTGPYMTARRSDEILTQVEFPERPASEIFVIEEVSRLRGGFPLAGVAIALTADTGPSLHSVALACFGVHSTQLRVPTAEAILRERGCSADAVAAAADAIDAAITPHSDPFASAAYRRSAVRTLVQRALQEAVPAHAHKA